jgi:hypothetical protein
MMSLGKQLTARLRLLTREGIESAQALVVGDNCTRLTVTDDQHTSKVALELFDYDRYSVTMRTLELTCGFSPILDLQAPSDEAIKTVLSAYAANIIRQLNYLEEPLAVWELEHNEQAVQLRSSPPQREEADVFYWEALLQVGERSSVTLARYHWAEGMVERELAPYPVTCALVARIADSLHAALQ